MGCRLGVGIAAGLLNLTGVAALCFHDAPSAVAPLSQPTTTTASPSTSVAPRTTSSVGGGPVARPTTTLAPVDAPPQVVLASTPVVPPPPPTDEPAVVVESSCTPVRLTVLRVDGCAVTGLVTRIVTQTQEAAAPPE